MFTVRRNERKNIAPSHSKFRQLMEILRSRETLTYKSQKKCYTPTKRKYHRSAVMRRKYNWKVRTGNHVPITRQYLLQSFSSYLFLLRFQYSSTQPYSSLTKVLHSISQYYSTTILLRSWGSYLTIYFQSQRIFKHFSLSQFQSVISFQKVH